MRYSHHEFDKHQVVATTVAADRDEALEWFSEKLRLMLTFEGDPVAAEYLLDEWSESLPYMAHTPKPTISVFIVLSPCSIGYPTWICPRLFYGLGNCSISWL